MNSRGPTLRADDITIQLCTDPTIREDPVDPSGLQNMSATALDGLMSAIRETYVIEANRAPTVLRDAAPRVIHLCRIPDQDMEAGMIFENAFDAELERQGEKILIKGIKLGESKALGLKLDDRCTITNELIGVIAHECRHLLTRHSVHVFNYGASESLNSGLDNHYYPDTKNSQRMGLSRDRTYANTGLNSPSEWGRVVYSKNALEALYMCAQTAMDGATAEELWTILGSLAEHAYEQKRYPFQYEVRATIEDVLQDRSKPMLASPAFKPHTEGNHIVAFEHTPQGGNNSLKLRSFSTTKNLKAGLSIAQGKWNFDMVSLVAEDTYTHEIRYELHDKKGRRMDHITVKKTSKGTFTSSFEQEMERMLQQAGERERAVLRDVGSIRLNVENLGVFKLEPHKS